MQNLNVFGCACRCVIELCSRNNRPITEADFLAEFSRKYPSWFRRTGLTSENMIAEICRKLGISSKISITIDKDLVIDYFQKYKNSLVSGILIYTERMPVPPNQNLGIVYHCMLLVEADQAGFKVWCPYQDGTHQEITLTWKEWADWMMHATVLVP